MTPQSFRDNPATWHLSVNLRGMLFLLQHLANDGNVTMALLAADFAERTLPYAGSNEALVADCVTSVRTWSLDQTYAASWVCKNSAQAARAAAKAVLPVAVGVTPQATQATQSAAYSAYYAAYSTDVPNSPASTKGSPAYTYSAAYYASVCAYTRTLSDAAYREEQQWQLAHVRRKHPLTEL